MSKRICATLLWISFISQPALAQVTTGAISGTVRDATGAVLPGATVTIKHVETGMNRTTVTNDEGHYRLRTSTSATGKWRSRSADFSPTFTRASP